MKADYEGLSEMLKGLQHTVLGEAGAARDSSLAPMPADVGEAVLAELRLRRERLRHLIRLISQEARLEQGAARNSSGRTRCRRSAGTNLNPVC